MSMTRVEAQTSLFPLPPRMPEYRRCHCVCGCGRWWYQRRTPGRTTKYATPECFNKVRRMERAAQRGPRMTECACGCGTVFQQPNRRGRPYSYADPSHRIRRSAA